MNSEQKIIKENFQKRLQQQQIEEQDLKKQYEKQLYKEITLQELEKSQTSNQNHDQNGNQQNNNQKTLNSFFCQNNPKTNLEIENGTQNDQSEAASLTSQATKNGLKKPKIGVKPVGKFFLHPKSHLNDPTLMPRKLEQNENIFDIIMPWQEEQFQEEQEKLEELLQLGKISEKEHKERQKNKKDESKPQPNAGNKQTTLNKYSHKMDTGLEQEKRQKVTEDTFKHKIDPNRLWTLDQIFSKTVKVNSVQNFDWTFQEDIWNPKIQKFENKNVEIRDIQAIYINPRWKISKVGQCLTNTSAKHNDSSDEEMSCQNVLDKGLTVQQFCQLEIPTEVMKDGMIFIWVEKEFISDVINHLEQLKFTYVENVCYVMLDKEMEKGKQKYFFNSFVEVNQFKTIDATPAIVTDDFTYLKKSHKSLLMFRRQSKDDSNKLELRHQRTGDVVFDWRDPTNPHKKPDFYIYRLIEILLPNAQIDKIKKDKNINFGGSVESSYKKGKSAKKEINLEDFMIDKIKRAPLESNPKCNLRMVELWAQSTSERRGWLKVLNIV